MDVRGERWLDLRQDPLLGDVLVAGEDLGRRRLQARLVADHSNQGETTAKLATRHVLHDLYLLGTTESSLPAHCEPSLLIAVQLTGSLVQVYA